MVVVATVVVVRVVVVVVLLVVVMVVRRMVVVMRVVRLHRRHCIRADRLHRRHAAHHAAGGGHRGFEVEGRFEELAHGGTGGRGGVDARRQRAEFELPAVVSDAHRVRRASDDAAVGFVGRQCAGDFVLEEGVAHEAREVVIAAQHFGRIQRTEFAVGGRAVRHGDGAARRQRRRDGAGRHGGHRHRRQRQLVTAVGRPGHGRGGLEGVGRRRWLLQSAHRFVAATGQTQRTGRMSRPF